MDEQMISCTIDGKTVTVERGSRILDACERAGIKIPTLCYLKDVNSHGSCGVCMVEVEGAKRLVRSCMHTVLPGMVIHTHTQRVLHARKLNLELVLANHPLLCTSCERNLNCELQALSQQLGVRTAGFLGPRRNSRRLTSPLNPSSAIQCLHTLQSLCTGVCHDAVGLCHPDGGTRTEDEGCNLLRRRIGQFSLHQLRTVLACLPDCGHYREKPRPAGL